MTAPTLYRIVDVFDYLDREDEYTGLTLEEAAHRMDDLTGIGADVILSDWAEPCSNCEGAAAFFDGPCTVCGGTGGWPGPWKHVDPETGRETMMLREVGG